jgi:hypothetical protein
MCGGGPDCRLCLRTVGRHNDRHIGDGPHNGDILHRLMGTAVLADRHPSVRCHDLYIGLGIGDRLAHLLPRPADRENGEGGNERNLAGCRQTGGRANHVGFGDPHVEKALRKFFREYSGFGGTGKIGVQRHDIPVLPAQLCQRLAIGVSCRNHAAHILTSFPCS